MNDLLKALLPAFVAPLITLLLTFLGYRRTRTEATKAPLDTPALKIIAIIRSPVDKKSWKTRKFLVTGLYGVFAITLFTFDLVLPQTLITLLFPSSPSGLLVVSYLLTLLPLLLFIRLIGSNYLITFKTPYDGRYFFFKTADILIEAKYQYLFTKCHEALRSLRANIVEVREGVGRIEAYKESGFIRLTPLKIQVDVRKVEGSESAYQVNVELVRLVVVNGDWVERTNPSRQTSLFTNSFINALISKPQTTEQKPQIESTSE